MPTDFKERFLLAKLHRDEIRTRNAFLIILLLFIFLFGNSVYLANRITTTKPPTPVPVYVQVTPTLAPSPTPLVQQVVIPAQTAVKEYFIPFGAGSNQSSDWMDVPGLQATLDFGNYPNIKEVHFEASVVIPTANETASVRLFNVTDKHPVWYSEINLLNNDSIVSPALVYDSGPKVYQVQMKTSLQYLANLVQARIHITLQ